MSNRNKAKSAAGDGELAVLFAALGDKVRLQLVTRLMVAGAMSATALADGEFISRQAIVKHLQVLEAAGLAVHSRHGREVLYALDARRLLAARAYLDAVSAHWDASLERLRNLVEAGPAEH
jgi:DNA-binding transcriptional ArsR family regulator